MIIIHQYDQLIYLFSFVVVSSTAFIQHHIVFFFICDTFNIIITNFKTNFNAQISKKEFNIWQIWYARTTRKFYISILNKLTSIHGSWLAKTARNAENRQIFTFGPPGAVHSYENQNIKIFVQITSNSFQSASILRILLK